MKDIAKVFILIGINDISRNIPDSIILESDRKIIEHIKQGSPNTKIYFQTIMPVNNTFTQFKNYNKDEHIRTVNEGLKKIAEDEHIVLIDIHSYLLDSEGRMKKEYTLDGLHPNAEGDKIWKKILLPFLK